MNNATQDTQAVTFIAEEKITVCSRHRMEVPAEATREKVEAYFQGDEEALEFAGELMFEEQLSGAVFSNGIDFKTAYIVDLSREQKDSRMQ